MAEPESVGPQMPRFDPTFRHASPFCYFHHIIDADAASIHVEVIGPNLSTTFTHNRARDDDAERPATILAKLEQKTSGFLALAAPDKCVVIAWAVSGHGFGRRGDLLDAGPHILASRLWTQRAIQMGGLLGLRMGSPFDGVHAAQNPHYPPGATRASHVEIKLAVHAVHLLLKTFLGGAYDPARVTRRHLEDLRTARWEDGSPPAFDVWFSRRECTFCRAFVARLEEATGVTIRLRWRHRLVRYKYAVRPDRDPARWALSRLPVVAGVDGDGEEDLDVVDLGEVAPDEADDSYVEIIRRDVEELELIDLTAGGHHDMPFEIIDDDMPTSFIDMTAPGSPTPSTFALSPMDAFLNGLAYSIGQIAHYPVTARAAVVDLAMTLRAQRQARAAKPDVLVVAVRPAMQHRSSGMRSIGRN